MTEKPEFTDGDKMNPLWKKFQDYFQWRLETLRVENDRDAGKSDTAKRRGRIAEARLYIDLDKPVPKFEQ